MKKIQKLIAGSLIPGILLFISCTKNPTHHESPPAPPRSMDTLSGRGFEFNALTWRELVSGETNVIVRLTGLIFFSIHSEC